MQTFQYVDQTGQLKTIQANSQNEALASVKSINPQSGIMATSAPQPTTQPTATQSTTPVQGSMGYDIANNLAPGTSSQATYKPTISDAYGGNAVDKAISEGTNYFGGIANAPLKTEQEIFEDKRKLYQAEIDAVNRIYSDKIQKARIAGQGRLGSSTASQSRSGLLGSDFGLAQTDNVTEQNREVENAYLNEQSLKIAELLGRARSDAVAEAEAKRVAKEQGASKYIEFLTAGETRKKARITDLAKSMVAQGLDIKTMSDTELSQLATTYGVSKDEIRARFNEEKLANDKLVAETAKSGLGTGIIGEYNFYVQQETQAGRTPLSFAEYQTEDANRKAQSTTLTPYQQFQATQSIAKDNAKRTENSREITRQSQLIIDSYNNIINGGDRSLNTQAIITSFNKILDPTSVVRESEYDRTAEGQSLIARLQGKVQNIVAGGAGVTPQTLKEASDIATTYLERSRQSILAENQRAIDMANQFGLNSQFVTSGQRPTTEINSWEDL